MYGKQGYNKHQQRFCLSRNILIITRLLVLYHIRFIITSPSGLQPYGPPALLPSGPPALLLGDYKSDIALEGVI